MHAVTQTQFQTNLSCSWYPYEFLISISSGVVIEELPACSEVRLAHLKVDVVQVLGLRTVNHTVIVLISYLLQRAVERD